MAFYSTALFSSYSGFSGQSGYSGLGLSGTSGSIGESGTSGASGFSGIGFSGGDGDSGYSGTSGFSGLGYSGPAGDSGESGYSGGSGTSGYSGLGLSGTSGAEGTSGYSGMSGYSSLSGTSGASGESGAQGGSGTSGLSGTSGFTGYSGSSGSSGGSGYSGSSGDSGSSGASGAGTSGYSGYSGYSGEAGGDGDSGYSGTSGYSSLSGTSGYSGYSGYSGASAYSGTSGKSGYSGLSGYTGYSGIAGLGQSNVIDNSNFNIYQRGSPMAITDDTYGPDRWNILTQTAGISGLGGGGAGPGVYYWGLKQYQASAQRVMFTQIIPAQKTYAMRSQDHILRLNAYQDTGGAIDIRYAVLAWTGTADAVTSDVVNDWTSGTYTAGNFFNSTTLSVIKTGNFSVANTTWVDSTVAISAAEMGATATNYVVCFFPEGTLAQNKTFYLCGMDMYQGTAARAYVAPDPSAELHKCQRYYVRLTAAAGDVVFGLGQSVTTTIGGHLVKLPNTMRSTPALGYSDVGHFKNYDWAVPAGYSGTAFSIVAYEPGDAIAYLGLTSATMTAARLLQFRSQAAGWFSFSIDL